MEPTAAIAKISNRTDPQQKGRDRLSYWQSGLILLFLGVLLLGVWEGLAQHHNDQLSTADILQGKAWLQPSMQQLQLRRQLLDWQVNDWRHRLQTNSTAVELTQLHQELLAFEVNTLQASLQTYADEIRQLCEQSNTRLQEVRFRLVQDAFAQTGAEATFRELALAFLQDYPAGVWADKVRRLCRIQDRQDRQRAQRELKFLTIENSVGALHKSELLFEYVDRFRTLETPARLAELTRLAELLQQWSKPTHVTIRLLHSRGFKQGFHHRISLGKWSNQILFEKKAAVAATAIYWRHTSFNIVWQIGDPIWVKLEGLGYVNFVRGNRLAAYRNLKDPFALFNLKGKLPLLVTENWSDEMENPTIAFAIQQIEQADVELIQKYRPQSAWDWPLPNESIELQGQ